MRHFRMSNKNFNHLITFKKQIGSMLKELNKFDEADKNEAITYLRKCINTEGGKGMCEIASSSMSKLSKPIKKRELIKKNNSTNVARVKVSTKSQRFTRKSLKNRTFVKRAILRCRLCSVKKRSLINFLKHLNTHIGTPISCKKCRQNFNGKVAFDFHLVNICGKDFVSKKTFKCIQCSREFKFKRHLQSHMEGHKRNNCKYCDTVFTNKKYLIKHLTERHSLEIHNVTTRIHKCEHCDKRYIQKRSLYCHLKQHVPGKYVCLDCGLIIDELQEYKSHIDLHYKEKKWQCSKCDLRFTRKQHLYIHLKKHDMYKCLTCNNTYASKAIVLQHRKKGHLVNGLEPKMMCPVCPKVFYRSITLQQHMKKHNGNFTSMTCKYCEKTFTSQYQYYRHCLTVAHEKNSPDINELLCEICGKNFNKKYLLDDHIYRSHSKKELLSCLYCEYKTTNKTNMKRHNIIHMPSEDYICEQCGKHFTNIFSLREHVSYSHIQIKQYKCDQCDKIFKRKSELARHKKIHSDERPYVCKLCGSSYKRNTHLTRHEKSAHKIMHTTTKRIINNSLKMLNNEEQRLDVYQINVSDLITDDIPVAIPSIDQNTLNETLWNDSDKIEPLQEDVTFNNNNNDNGTYHINPIQEYNTSSINVDQLVASYIPEKSTFYQEPYNVQFDNVIISDVVVSRNNFDINRTT